MGLGKVAGPSLSSFKHADPSQGYDNDAQTSKREPALRVAAVLLKKACLYFRMCLGVFPACMSTYYTHAVPVEPRRGHGIP